MLVVKSGQDQEKAQVESSSQGNQLFPTLEGQDTKVSTLKHRAPSPDGSPEAKKARMGSIKQLSTCSQSVAERLKESTQKLQEKPTSQNGATVPSVTEVKSPYSAFTGQKDLNEEQLNQVRVIAQHLKELGLREAVNALVEETGCKIEHTYASQIRKCIKTGNWKEALSYLDKSSVFIDTRQYEGARRELVLHKILGLLDEGQKIECIQLMREEHSRYHKCREFRELRTLPFLHPDRLKKAPVMITYRTPGYFDQVARSVEAVLPSNFMLQESRLDDLFSKAVKHQIEHCPHHMITKVNSNDTAENILRDHVCEKNKNEIHDGQKILTREVLRSEFSPNGKYFIAASTTRHISLYKCAKKTGTLEHLRNFKPKPNYKSMRVTDMSWSWDSKLVAICGSTRINLEPLKVTVYETETGKIHRTIIKRMSQSRDTPNIDYSTLCFSWGSYKLAVADENGHFQVFDVTDSIEKENPPNVCNWEGLRLKRIHSLKSGALLCLDTHNRIRKYCMNPKTDDTVVREFLSVNNFIVHNSEKYVLTNTELNMHLWDITERSLVRTYRTFPSKDAIIDCAFGGPFEEYFATGTPDGRIFVYNINETEPLLQIKGHLRYINSVAWHPKSGMIATSGSDSVIRVWHLGCDLKDCTALPVKAAPVTSRKKIRKAKENAKKIAEKETVERNAERKMKAYESGAEERESQRLQEVAKKLECSPNSITASLAPLGRKDLAITLAPPKKTGIETSKIKKKRRRSNKEGDSISLPLENGVDEQKKSNRKRKRRRTKKSHDDESMEVDDSSIGKAAPSGSENGSVHSHL